MKQVRDALERLKSELSSLEQEIDSLDGQGEKPAMGQKESPAFDKFDDEEMGDEAFGGKETPEEEKAELEYMSRKPKAKRPMFGA
jgi:hypothetical protein